MGKSKPLDDLWRHTPRSAEPEEQRKQMSLSSLKAALLVLLQTFLFMFYFGQCKLNRATLNTIQAETISSTQEKKRKGNLFCD